MKHAIGAVKIANKTEKPVDGSVRQARLANTGSGPDRETSGIHVQPEYESDWGITG